MGDLTFSSYLQGPLGGAIKEADNMGTLPAAAFTPSVTLTGPQAQTTPVRGPDMHLLGPGDVIGLAPGTVSRMEPPSGSRDVEPNYLAAVEVSPPELPWVLTPAQPNGERLRPWLVLVVLEAASAPVVGNEPLPYVEAEIAQLPDLMDSWGWAHIQRRAGGDDLPGGAQAAMAQVARLLCPRRLNDNVTYRACLVPAFDSGRLAGLGDAPKPGLPHAPAWNVDSGGTVRLPVYHEWTFTTGPDGDFEQLVSRLRGADLEALRANASRPADVRAPWQGEAPLSDQPQVVGVQGALCPFTEPDPPASAATPEALAALDSRLREQLNSPSRRLQPGPTGPSATTLAPPLYGARHVLQDRTESSLAWIGQLNASVANRIAAGLGAAYVRTHQEDLMDRAWQQVGAIRELNRLRATVELTTTVAERVHERHLAALNPGELMAFAAPAQARARTSETTTLALEVRMSRLTDGVASSAFARRMRPAGKLARRTSVSGAAIVARGLAGEVGVPAGDPVVPPTPGVGEAGVQAIISAAASRQLAAITALSEVAAVNGVPQGDLSARVNAIAGGDQSVMGLAAAGDIAGLAGSIAAETVTATTAQILADMSGQAAFGGITADGVPIAADGIAARLAGALHPSDSHFRRLQSQTTLPERFAAPKLSDPVMACPSFPVPTALALLQSDPEWFLPGLGKFPMNRVALLRQNAAFIESFLVGINHEMMRELLWREYPTDQRGTPFTVFWPRLDGSIDINPINTWTDAAPLGDRLLQDEAMVVLLVRGDVVRRYPGMVVTAVRSAAPGDSGYRPDPSQTPKLPQFVIPIDEQTSAYAFEIPEAELRQPATPQAPGWFFVFSENGYRIRFGFDSPDAPPAELTSWSAAAWPPEQGRPTAACVPVARGHAVAGAAFGPPDGDPRWNRDSCDIARITLQKPFRVAIQADILLRPEEPS